MQRPLKYNSVYWEPVDDDKIIKYLKSQRNAKLNQVLRAGQVGIAEVNE